jgi:DNA-directed RNA polymerase specialized sigma24 family protein
MQMTTLLNRTYDTRDEQALIRSEPISMQWTKELRRSIALHPGCKLLRGLLSLDLNTRTVVYPLLIKGWTSRQIANRLRVSLTTIHKLLETGRQQLQSSLATPDQVA